MIAASTKGGRMDARIVGWGHTPFGRHEDKSLEDLIVDAASQALDHAGIEAKDVDAIWLGHFNSGLVADGFPPEDIILDPNIYAVATGIVHVFRHPQHLADRADVPVEIGGGDDGVDTAETVSGEIDAFVHQIEA